MKEGILSEAVETLIVAAASQFLMHPPIDRFFSTRIVGAAYAVVMGRFDYRPSRRACIRHEALSTLIDEEGRWRRRHASYRGD